jgi:hypothetical protein
MSQTRCCVVCSRSSPKTIFSCRYKVHQRNIEVLRVFFKRELDFGELCDRCYRLWYKHKRAKKEGPANDTQANNKTPRRKRSPPDASLPSTPTPTHSTTPNNFYNNIIPSMMGEVTSLYNYPPIKKFKKPNEMETDLLTMNGNIYLPPPINIDQDNEVKTSPKPYINHFEEKVHTDGHKLNHADLNHYHFIEQEEEDLALLDQIQEEEALQQQQQPEQQPEGLLASIRSIINVPRKSKRKPAAIKSPSKPDPIYNFIVDTNYQKLFTSGMFFSDRYSLAY